MRKNCSDYPVEIIADAFAEGQTALADMLRKTTDSEHPRVMLVADQTLVEKTAGLGTRIGRWVQENGIDLACAPMLIPGGERTKEDDMETGVEIANAALAAQIGAHDILLILGGGTILDATGWAAAQVRGGIPTVRLPTTPSAMVDAAFASYAALNAPHVKDAFSTPSHPAGVLIDPNFATTVTDGVWRAGLSTAMRQACVTDATLVKKLTKIAPAYRDRDPKALKTLIDASVTARLKKGATDFALWATHRLESLSEYRLPYGYAMMLGMELDLTYATLKGALKESDRQAICATFETGGLRDLANSGRHLMAQADDILLGLDAWRLRNGTGAITIPSGIGLCEREEKPDRDTMKQAINLLK